MQYVCLCYSAIDRLIRLLNERKLMKTTNKNYGCLLQLPTDLSRASSVWEVNTSLQPPAFTIMSSLQPPASSLQLPASSLQACSHLATSVWPPGLQPLGFQACSSSSIGGCCWAAQAATGRGHSGPPGLQPFWPASLQDVAWELGGRGGSL